MADQVAGFREHLFVSSYTTSHRYQRPSREIPDVPRDPINRGAHGALILNQVVELVALAAEEKEYKIGLGFGDECGLIIQIEGRPQLPLALESIENQVKGIELLSVRIIDRDGDKICVASVFVPDGKLSHLEKSFREYIEADSPPSVGFPSGRPKHQDLAESIASLRRAAFDALWTDPSEALPSEPDALVWWEVWLPVRKSRVAVTRRFRAIAEHIHVDVAADEQHFPERSVLLMQASRRQIEDSIVLLDCVAEIRRAKRLADFYLGLNAANQREHIDQLLARVQAPVGNAPAVCLLDTGVNWGHPLLGIALAEGDCLSVNPNWGSADEHGHGTELAGIALFGDLVDSLSHDGHISLAHRLESVKLLAAPGENGPPRLYGSLTYDAVSQSEVNAPTRARVFNLAISAGDNYDEGRPSAWSTTLDEIAYGDGTDGRLVVVSAGNVPSSEQWVNYPLSNREKHIHDPAQAWNALTVGSYTAKVNCTDRPAEYRPVAADGGLSPFSTTSCDWDSAWPLKPDVVFEGGNAAVTDAYAAPYAETPDSLLLLTASNRVAETLLATTGMTSASAALGSRFAAQLMAQYPRAWPETIRALIVHSASWTDEMKRQFLDRRGLKTHYANLVQHCGFGVPDLDKAIWSAKNSLILIVEQELQPFERIGSNPPKAKDMRLHQLPWPKDILEGLNADVRLRVTLSYFVEPNPRVFGRGIRSRYAYESHGLRFKVKTPAQSDKTFLRQVTALADGDVAAASDADPHWLLGEGRFRGSLHSDVWTGRAADLASRGTIAVFPTTGWWKTRTKQQRWNSSVRYSLVVSIEAPEVDVDLYSAVASQIEIRNRQPVEITTGV
jgi:hypothetical protein